MQQVRLGRTNLQVGRLGFGGIPIQRLSQTRAVRLIREALDQGVTLFDTARAYMDSEAKIGAALAGRRDQAVIATKSPALDAAGMTAAIATSLSHLQTDWIDLYQLHGLQNWADFEKATGRGGALQALRRARRAGQVRFFGVTSHSPDLLKRILTEAPEVFDTVQVPFNFVGDESGASILPLALRHDVGFLAMKPFGGGVLDRPDLAFRYVLQYAGMAPIPGMETLRELRQNVQLTRESQPLSPAELRVLKTLRKELGRTFCRKCNYCQPCPQGITIHLALGAKSHLRRFDRRLLGGWCRDVLRKATTCVECGACEQRCPYHLPIRDLLKENVALFRRGLRSLKIAWE